MRGQPTPAHRNPVPILGGSLSQAPGAPGAPLEIAPKLLDRPVVGTAWLLNGFNLTLSFATALPANPWARRTFELRLDLDVIATFEFVWSDGSDPLGPEATTPSDPNVPINISLLFPSPYTIFDTTSLTLREVSFNGTISPNRINLSWRGQVGYA